MGANLPQAIFTDETTAREWLELRVWPNGPVCPHCGTDREKITGLHGKAHRPGVYQCNVCRKQFTITVKTVFEKSRIPLSKWLTALFLMTASKRGMSGHEVHRLLGISYKSTWFMCNRLREAMRGLEKTGKSGEPRKPPSLRQARRRPHGLSRLPRPRKPESLDREYVRDDAHARPTPRVVKV